MDKSTTKIALFEKLYNFLQEKGGSPAAYIQTAVSFSRNRSLNFERVVVFILHMAKRSMSVELEHFFAGLGLETECVTKSALTQARYKIKATFYKDWNAELISAFEQGHEFKVRRWKGFRLFGIDGSTLYLVNNEDMRAHFGVQKNAHVEVPMARIVCRYDLINGLCDYYSLNGIGTDELTYALEQVGSMPSDGLGIHDRGHASFVLMFLYRHHRKHFLIRSSLTFNNIVKEFVKSSQKSRVVTMYATPLAIKRLEAMGISIDSGTSVRVRLVKVMLSSGEIEILMTSLPAKKFNRKRLAKLYFRRWRVETYFDRLKNKLQVEKFCGHLPQAIYQEFFAMVFLSNIHSLICGLCKRQVKEIGVKRRYDYQINANVTLGLLQMKLIAIFLKGQVQHSIQILINRFIRYLEPVRPNRSFQRVVKTKRTKGKYQTHTNYRAAA